MLIAIAAAAIVMAPAVQDASAETSWTWTLYEDDPIVLAHEVPDTANLRSTLQCDRGSNIASLTLYGGDGATGTARLSAGDASAMGAAEPARGGGLKLTLRTDHPVFAAFGATGRLGVAIGEQRRSVEIAQPHLAKLRRFAELCSG